MARLRFLIHRVQGWHSFGATILILLNQPGGTQAQLPDEKALAVNRTIDRGFTFLARDALAWKKQHDCASCHHAALFVCAMNEAKISGHMVDEPVLTELTRWLTEAGDGKFNHPRPPSAPHALNPQAVYYALGLQSIPTRDPTQREALRRLLATVKSDQTSMGCWESWPESRPPILGPSDGSATVLACLALLPAALMEDPDARAAIDKAVNWLKNSKRDSDPQTIALQLVLWTRLGRPQAEWAPLVRTIKRRQNRDGGWSQTSGGPSDAWATGQALYALSHTTLDRADRAIPKGRAFLVKSQRENGSWPMASRPTTPGGTGSVNVIPITGGGSAWALMGLARSGKHDPVDEAAAALSSRTGSFAGSKAGEEISVGGITLNWCPPGKFRMGSPPGELDRRPDENQVKVTLTKGFWAAKFEATQGDWKRVMGILPGPLTAELPEGGDYPVGNVNFDEAEAFCRRLTETTHQSGELPQDWEFRLPTEAQWEYACRAGTSTATAFGDKLSNKQANFKGKPYNGGEPGPSLNRARSVGSYPGNAWGLHDMHGNSFEWCRDWYHAKLPGGIDPDLYAAHATAAVNRTGDTSRSRRGGAWTDDGWACRSAFRLKFEPHRRYDHIGFRVVIVHL